ncbi:hypothetical protein [Pseudooceanicola nitratireducens]|uniref:hypothetical protein n=1 Tax=Pseudooceanicola nitratireducens TaxID=517719 RepID=UPI0033409460
MRFADPVASERGAAGSHRFDGRSLPFVNLPFEKGCWGVAIALVLGLAQLSESKQLENFLIETQSARNF